MKICEEILDLHEKLIIVNKNKKSGQILFLSGGAGCYPEGTEFMTPTGWKKIEDYSKEDKVLQYDKDTGKTDFVDTIEYYNLPTSTMIKIENKNTSFITSIEHKHLMVNEKTKNKEVLTTRELLSNHDNLTRGNKRTFVNTFDYSGVGLNLSEADLRLRVAIMADGHFMKRVDHNFHKCRIRLKKERKISRLFEILGNNNIDYRMYTEDDYSVFEFRYTNNEKEFEAYWYGCSSNQLDIVVDEVLHWDGSVFEREDRRALKSFSSNSKKSADFIQFAFAATGTKASMYQDVREGRNTNYNVNLCTSPLSGIPKDLRHSSTTKMETVPYENNMYCFQVPTGFFVVRQNDRIFVSGNSGKGFAQDKFIDVSKYKIFDVDALKQRLLKIAKKKGNKELANLDLKKPDDVFKLHKYVSDRGLDKKQIANVLKGTSKEKGLPNLLFDVTLKDIKKFNDLTQQLTEFGYEPEDMHVVWVLADYKIATIQNQERPRVVPQDILFQTHKGASQTMSKILKGQLPKNLKGEIYVLLSEKGSTQLIMQSDIEKGGDSGKVATGKSAISGLETIAIKDFQYIKVKDAGKSIKSDSEIQKQVYDWVKTRVPKEVRSQFE